MSLSDLPDDIFHIIVKKLGDDDAYYLAPVILTNKRGRDIALSRDIVKSANLTALCLEPPKIYPGGVARSFFKRCLAVQNRQALYYEALGLVTRERDIQGSLALLNEIVPDDESATVAYAMFQMCAGRGDLAGATFDMIFKSLGDRLLFNIYSEDLEAECEG